MVAPGCCSWQRLDENDENSNNNNSKDDTDSKNNMVAIRVDSGST